MTDPMDVSDGNPDGLTATAFESTLSTLTVSVGSNLDYEYNPDELREDNSEPSGVFTSGTETVRGIKVEDVAYVDEKIELGGQDMFIQRNGNAIEFGIGGVVKHRLT